MTTYTFNELNSTNNAFWGVMVAVNNATSGFLGYGMLALIFIVSAYTFIRRTQDIGKSLLSSLHITTILALILYYAGKVTAVTFLSDVFMLGLVSLEALSIAGIYYARSQA